MTEEPAATTERAWLLELGDLAATCSVDTLDEDARVRYTTALLDIIAAYVTGRGTQTATTFEQVRGSGSGTGDLLLEAAGIAAAAHALELDDVHIDVTGWHPSASIFSPLLAVGRAFDLHGRDLLAGYVAGYEVGGRVGAAMTPAHRRRGFHATGTVGAIAAAAAVARARGLDGPATASAMGLATSMAGGTFGVLAGAPEAKHLHAAHGAMAGVWAVMLTEGGFRGPVGALEAPEGFYKAYADGDVDPTRLHRSLGDPWEIERQMIKPHACCAHAFGAIDAAGRLLTKQPDVLAELVADPDRRIAVHTYDAAAVLGDRDPRDPVAARLSVPWCVAQVLTGEHADGLLGMDAFTPAALKREDVRAVAARVDVYGSAESDSAFPRRRITEVSVADVGSGCVEFPRGMPETPVTPEQLRLKFRTIVGHELGEASTARLEAMVDDVAHTPGWAATVGRVLAGDA